MLPKRLLVIDVETTGLEPGTDCVIQLASCVLGRKDLREEKFFSSYVRPQTHIQAYAEAIHGLSIEDLKDAPDISSVIRSFADYAPLDVIICGHNVAFDVAFLKAAYATVGFTYPFDYHTLDLWSIAFFVLAAQRVSLPEYNLTSLCELYGIKRSVKHDALEDVRLTAQVLRCLFSAIKGAELSSLSRFNFFKHL